MGGISVFSEGFHEVGASMEFDEVVLGRRSIRGFKSDPVPKDLIREVMRLATRAPSSMNTQPWYFQGPHNFPEANP